MKHILQLGELEILAETITARSKVEPFDARYGVFVEVLHRAKLVALFANEESATAEMLRINQWIEKNVPGLSASLEAPRKLEFGDDENDSDLN